MGHYQKFVTTLFIGCFALASMAQDRVNFSGEWKLNESKSELGQFPLCIFGGDRMRTKSMKISAQADLLTINFPDRYSTTPGTRQAKLIFNGKESGATYVGIPREISEAEWSDNGQTMIVHSVRSFDEKIETPDFKVTEIWKLIDGGKSISIEVNSSSVSRGNDTMWLVYDRR